METEKEKCKYCRGNRFNQTSMQFIVELIVLEYSKLCEEYEDNSPLSADHAMGISMVIFKGDSKMCDKVRGYVDFLNYETEKTEKESKVES